MYKSVLVLFTTTLLSSVLSQTQFNCQSIFGRTANGDGTNTYSFECNCRVEAEGNKVLNGCRKSGANVDNSCNNEFPSPIDSAFNVQILSCTNQEVTVRANVNGASNTATFPLYCQGVGTAGLECNGNVVL